MLSIIHVYKDYWPMIGGIENHIKDLADAEAAMGHDVTVLVTNPGGQAAREQINGVQVIRAARLATLASTPLSLTFPFLLARLRPDVTHVHFPYPVGEMSQWLLRWQRPYVIAYHSDVVKQQTILRFYNPLLRRVLAGASRIIVGSDNYVQSSPYLRPLASKCAIVPYAVDWERFAGGEPLFPADGRFTLLFMGRHRYYKGGDDLIRAMAQLPAGLPVRLLFGGDGPLRGEWESLSRRLGVQDKITFVGHVSDETLPNFYASGDLFVLPANSRAEAFGKVLQEAMAAGLPCLATELGTGTSFVVQDGVTGRVVPPQQPELLAAAIYELATQPQLCQQLGQAGQQRAQREFSLAQMVEKVQAVYTAVQTKQT
ncbi:glycosyltransferase [Candidatus Leptofilum sp.]|uniref:glycosyltransferase n=1 Tax=Candidatus Leptofilum sp. TaxID=3241576 RepID=UPI003B591A8D